MHFPIYGTRLAYRSLNMDREGNNNTTNAKDKVEVVEIGLEGGIKIVTDCYVVNLHLIAIRATK